MGIIRLLPAAFVTLVLGVGLGCIPFVKEHLHWNLWFIIPVSGLALGMAFGAIQFGIIFVLNQKTSGMVVTLLAIAGAISYAGTDFGYYVSTTVPVEGVEGVPDGDYALSDMMSFGDYMRFRLGSSTIQSRHSSSDDGVEIGAAGTTISYVVDLLGAFVATLGTLFTIATDRPYCDPCGAYKKKIGSTKVKFAANHTLVGEIFHNIAQCTEANDGPQLLNYLKELKQKYGGSSGSMKIELDLRRCPYCSQWTAVGKVFRKGGNSWDRVNDYDFTASWHDTDTAAT